MKHCSNPRQQQPNTSKELMSRRELHRAKINHKDWWRMNPTSRKRLSHHKDQPGKTEETILMGLVFKKKRSRNLQSFAAALKNDTTEH